MRRQRNKSQMKEQDKIPEKQLNKKQTSNLLDTEFKTLVIRMLNELKGKVVELSDNFNSIKKGHGNHNNEPVRNERYTH